MGLCARVASWGDGAGEAHAYTMKMKPKIDHHTHIRHPQLNFEPHPATVQQYISTLQHGEAAPRYIDCGRSRCSWTPAAQAILDGAKATFGGADAVRRVGKARGGGERSTWCRMDARAHVRARKYAGCGGAFVRTARGCTETGAVPPCHCAGTERSLALAEGVTGDYLGLYPPGEDAREKWRECITCITMQHARRATCCST